MKELLDDLQTKEWIGKIHRLELEKLPSNEELRATYILSDVFHQKMKKLINRVSWKVRVEQFLKIMSLTAAVVLLAFSIINPKVFVNAAKSIMEWFENHVTFKFSENMSTLKIPKYIPMYLPDGYVEVMNEYYDEVFGIVVYEKEGKEPLSLEYGISDGGINIDNEGVKFSIIKGEGLVIYFFEAISQKESIATWLSEDGTIVFTLVGEESKEEFLKIIKNIEKK